MMLKLHRKNGIWICEVMADLSVSTENLTRADYKTAYHQMFDDVSLAVVAK